MAIDLNNGVPKIIKEPPDFGLGASYQSIVFQYAAAADGMPEWGTATRTRDELLRKFWPTEPVLASALFSTISRYAAFGWSLEGPPRITAHYKDVLNNVENGKGWSYYVTKLLLDLFTQDNGSFSLLLRTGPKPSDPPIGLRHLDSARCVRTGRSDYPVIYQDRVGAFHRLEPHQVIEWAEFPSPIENQHGTQYCTVTRMLTAAKVLRSIARYKDEKLTGRRQRSIHLVGGVNYKAIQDVVNQHGQMADDEGLMYYIQPAIIATLDPAARVSHEQIDLAGLPDHFDAEHEMRWYINQLALAFGADYQDFAPLPGGNLGTAQQSATLHLKARGKGPALFMSMIQEKFNTHGVLPNVVEFKFGERDVADDMSRIDLRKRRAEVLEILVRSGIITTVIARQILADDGDLDPKYLRLLNEADLTEDIHLSSTEPNLNAS